jgi:hypothetical protein
VTTGGEHEPAPVHEAQDRIAEAFNAYFRPFGIRITAGEVTAGNHRRITKRGWLITFRVDPDGAGLPTLEFHATNRMTDDRHLRIRSDGYFERLEVIQSAYGYLPDVPGGKEAAQEAWLRQNRAVARELLAQGLFPHGDVNAFLSTEGAEFGD